jgi:L-2-hydroxyglutarate oxidase LhgO
MCVAAFCTCLQANGSLLLATTSDEVQKLEARAAMLQHQGVPGVVSLSPRELKMAEPALKLPAGSHGLLVKSDAQIVSQADTAGAAVQ